MGSKDKYLGKKPFSGGVNSDAYRENIERMFGKRALPGVVDEPLASAPDSPASAPDYPSVMGNPVAAQVLAAVEFRHSISIGTRPAEAEFDIVIGNQTTCLRFARDGSVYLDGRLLGSDAAIYEGLRCFLSPYIKDFVR